MHGPGCSAARNAMLTDLYQITMLHAYWRAGISTREACFHAYFREHPFNGGFTVACGLAQVVEYIESLRFADEDIAYLATLEGTDGGPLFSREFLEWLRALRFTGDIDAVAEGTIVFPGEPLLRVIGPVGECQLVETALINTVNFQTLIATKAARVWLAAGGDTVIEFGLRRAQGPDGGLSASRAAYIGGCAATSNVLAGQRYGISVGGTHAHSWVMVFESEIEAFFAYADAMPNNVVLLVDTYDTLEGVRNAIRTGERLRARGHDLTGIRLDSGDLAWLSVRARAMLDEAGFAETRIYASNELDEYTIVSLKDQGAAVDVWGVGTRLATAHDQPSLGGVYKLSAIREPGGEWEPRIKLSEQTAKTTTPGLLAVRRFFDGEGHPVGDMIYDELDPPDGECVMVDPVDPIRRKRFPPGEGCAELLTPVFRSGELVTEVPTPTEARARTLAGLASLDASHKRFLNPHVYKVGLEAGLQERKASLVRAARGLDVGEP